MNGEANALEASTLVHSTFDQAGFVAHATKCIWKLTQPLQWSGFEVIPGGAAEVKAHAAACR